MTLQDRSLRAFLIAAAVASGCVLIAAGETSAERLQRQLKQLFPAATTFSAKEGNPPHYTAYVSDGQSKQPAVAGFAFWTTELAPLERGYEGPIKMLVGLDTKGLLTGVVVVEHHEPFGKISVDTPRFAAQFKGKSVRDGFKVGEDVDAVSTATITMTSAARAIKKSVRQIAVALLTPEGVR